LLALVDADYQFLHVGIKASGAGSDGVFGETDLKEAFENGSKPMVCRNGTHSLMMTSSCPTSSWVMMPSA